jgi:hypothetical protein
MAWVGIAREILHGLTYCRLQVAELEPILEGSAVQLRELDVEWQTYVGQLSSAIHENSPELCARVLREIAGRMDWVETTIAQGGLTAFQPSVALVHERLRALPGAYEDPDDLVRSAVAATIALATCLAERPKAAPAAFGRLGDRVDAYGTKLLVAAASADQEVGSTRGTPEGEIWIDAVHALDQLAAKDIPTALCRALQRLRRRLQVDTERPRAELEVEVLLPWAQSLHLAALETHERLRAVAHSSTEEVEELAETYPIEVESWLGAVRQAWTYPERPARESSGRRVLPAEGPGQAARRLGVGVWSVVELLGDAASACAAVKPVRDARDEDAPLDMSQLTTTLTVQRDPLLAVAVDLTSADHSAAVAAIEPAFDFLMSAAREVVDSTVELLSEARRLQVKNERQRITTLAHLVTVLTAVHAAVKRAKQLLADAPETTAGDFSPGAAVHTLAVELVALRRMLEHRRRLVWTQLQEDNAKALGAVGVGGSLDFAVLSGIDPPLLVLGTAANDWPGDDVEPGRIRVQRSLLVVTGCSLAHVTFVRARLAELTSTPIRFRTHSGAVIDRRELGHAQSRARHVPVAQAERPIWDELKSWLNLGDTESLASHPHPH